MIYALILTMTALGVLCHILRHMALCLLAAEKLIAELKRGQELDAETIRLKDEHIGFLERAIEQYTQRVAFLVGYDEARERRLNLLEWALSKYIGGVPKASKERAVAVMGEINVN